MEMIVNKQSVYFYGQVKDLPAFLSSFPLETTLLEFINFQLHRQE